MMSRERSILRLLAAVLLAIVAACGGSQKPGGPRLVVLLATCSVNADYLSPYNDRVTSTPNLERFAGEAVTFRQHITEAGQSGIAYASIFSGTQAPRHGAYRHPVVLSDDLYLISEAYADAGYDTYFWGGHPMADGRLNYGQGVDAAKTFDRGLTASDPSLIQVLDKLRADPSAKAFLLTSFTVTHLPYKNSLDSFCAQYPCDWQGFEAEEVARYVNLYRANFKGLSYNFDETVRRLGLGAAEVRKLVTVIETLYRSNIHDLDDLFGAIIGQLSWHGLLDQSLIAFTADHGENLYRENALFQWSHFMSLSPSILRVPLMIRLPGAGRVQRRVYDGTTRSIDVFPTLLGLSGLALPPQRELEGVDLSPAVRDGKPVRQLPAFSHTTVLPRGVFHQFRRPDRSWIWEPVKELVPRADVELVWVSAIEGDSIYKWRNLGGDEWGFEVFDLANDPAETVNLYDAELAAHREMAAKLRRYKAMLVESYDQLSADSDRSLSPSEEAKTLRNLGYI